MQSLGLQGDEIISITPKNNIEPNAIMNISIEKNTGETLNITGTLAVFTGAEMQQLEHGGILPLTVRSILAEQNII